MKRIRTREVNSCDHGDFSGSLIPDCLHDPSSTILITVCFDVTNSSFDSPLVKTVGIVSDILKVISWLVYNTPWTKCCGMVECVFPKTIKRVFCTRFGKDLGHVSEVKSTTIAHKVIWNMRYGPRGQIIIDFADNERLYYRW